MIDIWVRNDAKWSHATDITNLGQINYSIFYSVYNYIIQPRKCF